MKKPALSILVVFLVTAALLFLLSFSFSVSTSTSPAAASSTQHSLIIIRRHLLETSSTNPGDGGVITLRAKKHYHTDCPGTRTAAGGYSRSLCLQLQEMVNSRPPPRRRRKKKSSDQSGSVEGGEIEIEIDPRYGVEKRLVPSGPNPLHN